MRGHTPGPWTPDFRFAVNAISIYHVTGERENEDVCELIEDLHGPRERMDANARLIAAAPDLRLALMGAATWTVDGYGLCWCEEKTDTAQVGQHEPACTDARAAIAKAEGRET